MGNAEATRERILAAAMTEFAAFGIAGARVDRIAKAAGCNKNLIYIYFENKETLFATVLERNLSRVYDELVITPDDLPGFAVRVFDFAVSHPELMRLMAWFSLEQPTDGSTARNASIESKLTAIDAARERREVSRAFPSNFLLTAIMTLATAWSTANPFGRSIAPDLRQARENVSAAIRLLAGAE